MRIAFVDLPANDRSGASRFAREAVARCGDVSLHLAGADGAPDDDAVVDLFLSGTVDRWVFFGTEAIATRLVPLGLRGAVLVPMPELVHAAPDAYFLQFVLSRFAAFTRDLHRRLMTLGLRSAAFAHWPEPPPSADRTAPAVATAFFHELQTDAVPNAPSVIAQCAILGIGALHVRRAADAGGTDDLVRLGHDAGVAVTVSTDLDAAAQAAAREAMFVFASRPFEGLAHAIRTAMAAGQIVVAPDLPAANECIGHHASGILYDLAEPLRLTRPSPDRIAAMADAARARAAAGHAFWQEDVERFASFVRDDGRRWAAGDGSAPFANDLWRSAHDRAKSGLSK